MAAAAVSEIFFLFLSFPIIHSEQPLLQQDQCRGATNHTNQLFYHVAECLTIGRSPIANAAAGFFSAPAPPLKAACRIQSGVLGAQRETGHQLTRRINGHSTGYALVTVHKVQTTMDSGDLGFGVQRLGGILAALAGRVSTTPPEYSGQ